MKSLLCSKKQEFLSKIKPFEHWDTESKVRLCGRMERILKSYNDVLIFEESEPR